MTNKTRGAISIRSVTKRFGTLEALQAMDLDIEPGSYCCLLGPSGCGKTTLLRMIAGHDVPSSGDITIDGRSIVGVPSVSRGTAMMFQSYALFPHLSVLDNVAFALKMRGQSVRARHGRAAELLDKVGLAQFAQRTPGQLSGGQQQRVALARALITDPKVLLLDEPLSALDEFLRLKMRSELRRIQKDLGITFVHVTHSQLEAIGVADQVVVMDRGRIEQVGTPVEIFSRPRNAHVALFIGGLNVLRGTAEAIKNDSVEIHGPNGLGRLTLPLRDRSGVRAGEPITIAVRRDRLSLRQVSEVETAASNEVVGTVDAVEYQGTYVKVTIATAFEHEFVAMIADDRYATHELTIGSRVGASFPAESALLIESTP